MDSCLYCSFHYCDLCNCHSMLSLWQILMLFLFMIFGFSGLIMSEFYYKWALNFLLVVQLSFYKSSYTFGVQRRPSFKVKLSQHIWVVSTPDSLFSYPALRSVTLGIPFPPLGASVGHWFPVSHVHVHYFLVLVNARFEQLADTICLRDVSVRIQMTNSVWKLQGALI